MGSIWCDIRIISVRERMNSERMQMATYFVNCNEDLQHYDAGAEGINLIEQRNSEQEDSTKEKELYLVWESSSVKIKGELWRDLRKDDLKQNTEIQ